VPGEPGAQWTLEEVLTVKAKLFTYFTSWYGQRAAKFLRLGFHDCFRYTDGSGGCDGCLNWKGMEIRHPHSESVHERNLTITGANNGLGKAVQDLEKIYTDPTYPSEAPHLKQSLRDSGKSRADLWAFSAITSVEFGVEDNNLLCWEDSGFSRHSATCPHHQFKSNCTVDLNARPFKFFTGRRDCIVENVEEPYKTTKAEVDPNAEGSGRDTIKYFKEQFDMNGREVVAIMGSHTYGRPSADISGFPYTWTSRGTHLFNNDYYKNIVGEDRWYHWGDSGEGCRKVGDAYGTIRGTPPKSRWLTHTRMSAPNGGKVFWIKENYICSDKCHHPEEQSNYCCNPNNFNPSETFCKPDRPSFDSPISEDPHPNGGCEMWLFISGRDEIALNSEIGLYLDFEVDPNGIIYGCPGLEIFNTTMSDPNVKRTIWSGDNGGWGTKAQPECKKQMLQEPPGSEPLYKIMEDFAQNQDHFIRDFVLAMEKMLSNGYQNLALAPDHWTGIECVRPKYEYNGYSCFKKETPGTGPRYIIRSDWKPDYVITSHSLIDQEITWSYTGQPNQIWVWSREGNQLINEESGKPLRIDNYSEWEIVNKKKQRRARNSVSFTQNLQG